MGTLEDAIRDYAGRGWSLVLLPLGTKKLERRGWPDEDDDPELLVAMVTDLTKWNLAVRLGGRSAQLADVDLDDAGAVKLAPHLLPPTPATYGRDGVVGQTHYLYLAPDGPPPGMGGTMRLQGEGGVTYVELRWNEHYSVLPPSLHPQGGLYRWGNGRIEPPPPGVPPPVPWSTLADAVREVAAGALLLPFYPQWERARYRHYASLGLSAALLRSGWPLPRVEKFVYALARAGDDEEADARVTNARTTDEKLKRGDQLAGWSALSGACGDTVVKRFQRLLGIDAYASQGGAWAGIVSGNQGSASTPEPQGPQGPQPTPPSAAPTMPVAPGNPPQQGPGQAPPPQGPRLTIVSSGGIVPARPQVEVGHDDLLKLCEDTWAAVELMQNGHPDGPQLFRYGSLPVTIARWGRGGTTTPGAASTLLRALVDGEGLRNFLATTLIEFGRTEHQQNGPDLWIPDFPKRAQSGAIYDYLNRSGVPEIELVSGVPLMAPDGTVVAQAGYHAGARVYLEPEVTIAPIPDRPDAALIARCRDLWLEEALVDFPFKEQADRANTFAGALTPYLRQVIRGSVPLIGITAKVQGTGKSRLAAVIFETAYGNDYARMMAVSEGEEARKQITATLKDLPRGVLLDNVSKTIDSSALAKVLTDSFWSDRILGVSTLASFPVKCVWIATGNHLDYAPDMVRRVVPVYLDADMERPWDRPPSSFKHPELLPWVHDHRPDLVWSALVLCRAGLLRLGEQPYRGRSLGSFEGWARVLGSTLEAAGVSGFLENLPKMYEDADTETARWRDFVTDWFTQKQYGVTSSQELWTFWSLGEYFPLEGATERAMQTRLGYLLRQMVDRPLAGKKIRLHPTRSHGRSQYHLVDA